jgi:hypothetical protein
MTTTSRHISVPIARPAEQVYDYAADVAHLSAWASGLADQPFELVDGRWVADTPAGRLQVVFAEPNRFGVLDHDVTLPSGEVFYNPMRVIPDGDTSCEVVFTLRRAPGMSDEQYAADAAAVIADLQALKRLLEA